MIASLRTADSWLSEYRCIVSYSDIFFEASAINLLKDSSADIALMFDRRWLDIWQKRFVDPLTDAETFRLSDDCSLIEIGNTPQTVSQVDGQFMGIWIIRPSAWTEAKQLLDGLPSVVQDSIDTTGLLMRWIASNRARIEAIPYEGVWGEVDNQDDLKMYE